MISSIISSIIKPVIDGVISSDTSSCNVYLFTSDKPDSLEIELFTGNIKVQLSAMSETGIHPDILAGRQGEFVASPDPVNAPTPMQYAADVTALTYIVDTTFNGVVYVYAKNDTWYKVDMGNPYAASGGIWNLDGTIKCGVIPACNLIWI